MIYVVMVDDRHSDPDAFLFTSPESAIAYARSIAYEYARAPEDVVEEQLGDWLYYARYSNEGCSTWVVEKELDE